MKIYRCTVYRDDGTGSELSWYASRREADRYLLHAQSERGGPPAGIEGVDAVDILTDRAGLIAWLNQNCNIDNG